MTDLMRHAKYQPECPICHIPDFTSRKGQYLRSGPGHFRFRCAGCQTTFTRFIPQEIGKSGDINQPPTRKAYPRTNQGESHPQAKLKEQEVRDLLVLKDSGSTIEELAERYGVAKATIGSVLNGTTWSSITGIQPKTAKLEKRYKQRGRLQSNKYYTDRILLLPPFPRTSQKGTVYAL